MSSDLVGKTIGKYRIVARLGRGGMAEVYKGYQPGLDRYVAVKVLHSHLADEEDFIGRFEREATAVARLRHPNIVQVYDFDVEGSTYYMVMEFVEGPTLKAELKERSMKGQIFSLPEISRIFSALASAIDYAHSRGMVHRDLKPANVMFTAEGQVVLTDFGIARIMGATRYTMTGAISGTPAYMSPEQGQGERGDERSDIYSLGVILYEMVTGRVPFDADTPFAIIMKHINDPLPLPTTVNSAVPEVVERIILKAMSKNPADRYQSAGEMAKALRDALGVSADQTLAAMPISTIAPAPRLQEVTVAPGLDRTPTPAPGRVTQGGTMATAAQTAMPAAVGGLPVLPLALGAGAILVVCLIALAIIGTRVFTKTQMEQEAINLTQTALAIAMATEGVDTPTPVPTATATSAPTDTSTPAPTPTERVVVVTSTPLPATDTPTPLPPTDTPTPAPPTPTPKPVVVAPTRTPTPAPPTATPSPQAPAISGRLAIPIDDGAGHYNVVIYQLPGGNILGKIPRSRQPNFNPKGGTLLVNGEGGDHENIWEYNADGSGGRAVTGSPDDEHPFYNADGNSLVYDNPGLVTAKLGRRPEWHVFVQYGLVPVETGLVARDQVLLGDIFDGSTPMYPVWASDYSILFRACDYWKSGGGGSCGIWKADSGMTRAGGGAQSNPAFIVGDNAQPTDTKGSRLIYMSQAAGNWDVYSISLSGGAGTKLTDSPADDGLGTLSPDGQWLAFVSTRDGRWGVWVMPVSGGSAQRLPIDVPSWVNGYGGWASERISWGP
jgi:tRNA A-37 threonylcarbamoyl transferase component Bud32